MLPCDAAGVLEAANCMGCMGRSLYELPEEGSVGRRFFAVRSLGEYCVRLPVGPKRERGFRPDAEAAALCVLFAPGSLERIAWAAVAQPRIFSCKRAHLRRTAATVPSEPSLAPEQMWQR